MQVNCECDIILNISCGDDIDNLKNKVSCEFMSLLMYVEKGYHPDYSFIMDEISLLGIWQRLDKEKFIIQYYLNNPWETF